VKLEIFVSKHYYQYFRREIAEKNGYYVCELFTGHGVGELLHMPPMVHHTFNSNPYKMYPGSVFTIEPIFLLSNNSN
jgi:methionyl aminopeptidase